jgi:hypothetical protein
MRSYKQQTKRRRGGDVKSPTNISNVGMCKYNVNDSNVRVNSEDPYELHEVYQTCCPKKKSLFFGSKKNTSPFCKNLENQFKMLQEARQYENDEIFKKDNDRYLNDDDEDYYKPRNAITQPEGEEFGKEFKETVNSLGGKKMRKTKKAKKSRKSKKTKKSRRKK